MNRRWRSKTTEKPYNRNSLSFRCESCGFWNTDGGISVDVPSDTKATSKSPALQTEAGVCHLCGESRLRWWRCHFIANQPRERQLRQYYAKENYEQKRKTQAFKSIDVLSADGDDFSGPAPAQTAEENKKRRRALNRQLKELSCNQMNDSRHRHCQKCGELRRFSGLYYTKSFVLNELEKARWTRRNDSVVEKNKGVQSVLKDALYEKTNANVVLDALLALRECVTPFELNIQHFQSQLQALNPGCPAHNLEGWLEYLKSKKS